MDEIVGLLLRVTQSKETRHEQIVSMLLQMFTGTASVYVVRAEANRVRSAIDRPCPKISTN